MRRGNAIQDALLDDLIRELAGGPLTNRAGGGGRGGTGQGDNLAGLGGGNGGGTPRAGGISEPVGDRQVGQGGGLQAAPAVAPEANEIKTNGELAGNLGIIEPGG